MNMRWFQLTAGLLGLASLVSADNHKWQIQEIFSSVDETVQFIELRNQDKDEENLAMTSITTASGSFFAFPSNLPSSATENRHVLLATAAFAAIPGAPTPDYILPAGFLDHLGDTVTYQATPHAVSFGALPVDGRSSINAAGAVGVNSPTNFANQSGSVTLATVTVRNGSGVNPVWYSSSPAALGKLWTATIDLTARPSATAGVVGGYNLPASGPTIPNGQILFSAASGKVFELVRPKVGNAVSFSAMIPVDLALVGRTCATQGVVIGGGPYKFTNAVDMKMGW